MQPVKELLPENPDANALARALLQKLDSGEALDPAVKEALLTNLTAPPADQGDTSAMTDGFHTVLAATAAPEELTLDEIVPENEAEATVLRAVRYMKSATITPSSISNLDRNWFDRELNMNDPQLHNAFIALLKKHGNGIDMKDASFFFQLMTHLDPEYDVTGGSAPKEFSRGELLGIRRLFIQRCLAEIVDSDDYDPYNSSYRDGPSYLSLIRPAIYRYSRGEDVQDIVNDAIYNHNHDSARPLRAAYVKAVLEDTLANLGNEQKILDELNGLKAKFPRPRHSMAFESSRDFKHPRNKLVIKSHKPGHEPEVVRTVHPRFPMIAQGRGMDVLRTQSYR